MLPFILKSYQRFLNFLKKPDDRSFSRVNLSFKLKTLLSLLLLNVALSFVWILVMNVLDIQGLENMNSRLLNLPYWSLILVGVVVAPFIEELIFRFPMKYSRNYLLQFIIALVALFAPAESKNALYAQVRSYWRRYFWVFFYLLSTFFAFVHIYNYVDAKQLLLLSPLLTLMQFITGLIIGYIRVRFGFLWGWYYHAFFNLLFFSMAYASIKPSTEPSKPFKTKAETVVETNYSKTLKVVNSFDSCRVDGPDYTLYIKRVAVIKEPYAVCFGVTPSRIYFEQCTLQYMFNILSTKKIKIIAPKNNTYNVEFKMKKPDKHSLKTKEHMRRALIQAFSMQNQPL